jgi:hypothetical protein
MRLGRWLTQLAMAARPYIGRNILVETRPVGKVLLELHTILSGVAHTEMVVVMSEVPDDTSIIGDIQSVAGVIDVVQEASHGAVRRVCIRGGLDEVVRSGILGIGHAGACDQIAGGCHIDQRRATSSGLGVGRRRPG